MCETRARVNADPIQADQEVLPKRHARNCTLAILSAFVLITAAPGNTPSAASSNGTTIPQSIHELKNRVEGLLRALEIPGAGLTLVSRDSIIWAGGIGLASLEEGIPVTENTRFRVASITKSFTALGFLRLVEEGRLDLNTPIREIIPEIYFDNPWRDTDPVRIVHLLEHTSGIDSDHFNEAYNLHDDPDIPLGEVLAINPDSRRVQWRPGSRMAYSNDGYTVLGYILEKVTGVRFEDYLKEAILDSIGMITSSFGDTPDSRRLLAQGYTGSNHPLPFKRLYMRPASSLISSAREMGLFVQFLLNRGMVGGRELVRQSSIERMETPTTSRAARAGFMMEYGLGTRPRFLRGWKYHGHGGGIPGFNSLYAYFPELGLGCVVLVNSSEEGLREIFDVVFGFLVRDAKCESPKPITLTTSELEAFAGYYEYRNSERRVDAILNILLAGITLDVENDTLYQHGFMEERKALVPVTPNTFRKPDEPEASSIFMAGTAGNGMAMVEMGYSYYERTGSWKPFAYRTLVFGALILILSSVLYALIWIPVHLYKVLRSRRNRSGYVSMRVIPLLAVLSLVGGISMLTMTQPVYEMGQRTVGTVAFFVATWLFAGFSFLALVTSARSFVKRVTVTNRLYAVFLSLACCGMTLYLAYWDIIGLRLWAW